MHSKHNTLINISLIFITCIVVLVCIAVRPKSNNDINPSESESETTSTSETLVSEETSTESESDAALKLWYQASFSHLNIALSASAPPAKLIFNTDEEIYNFAVSQINERKYYNAMKYLQKVPNYKDSTQLQMKLHSLINQNFFVIDDRSGKIVACENMNNIAKTDTNAITRTDSSLKNHSISQRFDDGYVNSNGDFFITANIPDLMYKHYYLPIINYNKTTKFQFIDISKPTHSLSSSLHGYILTKNNKIIYFEYNINNNNSSMSFINKNIPLLQSNEKIVYINSTYAYSNTGNVYTYASEWKLAHAQKLDTLDYIRHHGIEFYLTNDGTITYDNYANETDFPAIKQWSDIIFFDAGSSPLNEYPDYCIGLTSSGAIYMALPHDSITKRILDRNCIYIAARAYGDKVYALTDSGDLHIYYIPNFPK